MDADARRIHMAVLVKQQRIVNGVRRRLAEELSAAIVARCGERDSYDLTCHAAVRRDVDRIWRRYYGAFDGDPRALWEAAIADCGRVAYEAGVELNQAIMERMLGKAAPELLGILKERAKRSGDGNGGG